MSIVSSLDAFVKPRHDLQDKSALGGVISLIAALTTIVLVLLEVSVLLGGYSRHSLEVTRSRTTNQLPIVALAKDEEDNGEYNKRRDTRLWGMMFSKFSVETYITFPHVPCNRLDLTVDGGAFSHNAKTLEMAHGLKQTVEMRFPTYQEMGIVTNYDKKLQSMTGAACTIQAEFLMPMVAGDVTISMKRDTWTQAISKLTNPNITKAINSGQVMGLNMSYYIHHVRFNKRASSRAIDSLNYHRPFENRRESFDNELGGLALKQFHVRLIPIQYQNWMSFRRLFSYSNSWRGTRTYRDYQPSVQEHTVMPETLVSGGVPYRPGLTIQYDFSPIAVKHEQMRDNLFVFFGNIIGIIGGVFVTVRLVVGCFLNTAASAVSKKKD